jgi:regulator of RNase E activity RraB
MTSWMESDHWDFYSCEIEGKPHSTMVNLSLFNVAPIRMLNTFYCIEVTLRHPSPIHGMTMSEEVPVLNDIEDLIGENQTAGLKYIGRQTGDGKRKFYFYGYSQTDFDSLMKDLDQTFPIYEKNDFNFEDTEWRAYFENLYPNAMAMNEIKNRAVFIRLEESGDDLSVPRTVDHSVVFTDKAKAKEFESIVKQKGFTVQVTTEGLFKKKFDLLVQRVDAPSDLDPITFELEQLAEGLGGKYDGWGCIAMASGD